MAYRVQSTESLAGAVRLIAHEETAEALARLTDLDARQAVPAIHDCRKRCKKVRGLVRLVRPALGDQYRVINRRYRDASRHLSDYRDAHALLGTFDDLVARSTDRLPDGGLGPVRAELTVRAQGASSAAGDNAEPVEQARRLLLEAQTGIDDWPIDDADRDTMAGGLALPYLRGSTALDIARKHAEPEIFHELRKRVKYTWYHVRLLGEAAPSILDPYSDVWGSLSDCLGDAHDLAVLEAMLTAEPDAFGGRELVDDTVALLGDFREELEQHSLVLAARLYVETPRGFSERITRYWDAWHEHGAEQPVGDIAELYPILDGLDELSVPELRRLATAVNLPRRSRRRRSELLAGLRAHGAASRRPPSPARRTESRNPS